MTVDWMVYQGALVGGVANEVRLSPWLTGTTSVSEINCLIVNVLKTKTSFSAKPETCSARSDNLA